LDRHLLLPVNTRHMVGPSHQVPWDELSNGCYWPHNDATWAQSSQQCCELVYIKYGGCSVGQFLIYDTL
jgi:hypothetical protein